MYSILGLEAMPLSLKNLLLKLYFFTGGGACVAGAGGGGVSSLNLPNVAGVFLVTVAGCIAAS